MRSLPLFHRIAGQPVIVLGEGAMAEPKRRLVERAGAVVVSDLEQGLTCGARLAFVAHEDGAACEADAQRLKQAGVLVNVVDRPELCDFTTPSILERDPVLIAIGTSGASAGLAKQLRLRLEGLLPARLGTLASGLQDARALLRSRWPGASERRQALDAALTQGGPLDPLDGASADRLADWLENPGQGEGTGRYEFALHSADPEDLTLRQSRLLGSADCVLYEAGVPDAILNRARADAQRHCLPYDGVLPGGLVVTIRAAD
ncbi:uroporphyrin-III C-methyltransferase/precorrin-2 dehydrogenase/sirohydrochlorin ferrochelatase [Altererythrobacter atlanticus]|uniref:precorrin-2 dehydrogenase n=1 Tax=Croceibacterium atlanticum TaxID=1267766 RepID=A0A0F7KT46_9SPHN|nr:bifunctional precorrin-2 dehydrogenase/sirohydrochlorin ferrochelatase [Croceibacterium atlanticum]AKH42336.1 Siroheme synthase [Croceibacterium atlanticum]MBB5731113.1 uroporphyrin-III C-methyltransferase/precorrin-2 dehydrogenase/sirohydrochlorin ferrochelatase [Croceibacterium atlanticum]